MASINKSLTSVLYFRLLVLPGCYWTCKSNCSSGSIWHVGNEAPKSTFHANRTFNIQTPTKKESICHPAIVQMMLQVDKHLIYTVFSFHISHLAATQVSESVSVIFENVRIHLLPGPPPSTLHDIVKESESVQENAQHISSVKYLLQLLHTQLIKPQDDRWSMIIRATTRFHSSSSGVLIAWSYNTVCVCMSGHKLQDSGLRICACDVCGKIQIDEGFKGQLQLPVDTETENPRYT